ncbi:MAG TPA: ribonuclease Z [Thermomicrobiales bacterium]|nr:ribonuclease Z [Thermomicrobiales bacterium]
MIDALLLGTGGMSPLPDRWLSALLVRCRGELMLFDCGEGTQIVWRCFGWGFRRLGAICISHTHADHIAGLPGLLHSIANAGRTEPVALFGPPGTALIVAGLRTIAPYLPYELRVEEIDGGDAFPLPGGLTGTAMRGRHALPVLAYRLDLPRTRRFLPERARRIGVPLDYWRRLQQGEPARWPGGGAQPADVLGPPRRGLALGYVTDTRPLPEMPAFFHDVDLLVSEGTYGDPADAEKAAVNTHMTFREAATLARESEARRLWLTHFSPGLSDPDAFAPEATAIFPETTVGFSGLQTTLNFDDEEGGDSI